MTLANRHLAQLSDADAGRLEQVTDRFEDAWQRGERPALRDYLPAEEPLRRAVLTELAHTDLEYRLRAGEPARAADYLDEFPELAADRDAARELLRAEGELRREAGDVGSTWPAPENGGPVRLWGCPTRLGKFLLQERLGAGACGAVYRALDTELQRTVAVKVPHAGALASQQEKDRFLREARSAAQLRHPGIVAVHDAGEWQGTCFLVSELVPGMTLAERLAAGRPPYRESAELVAQVADALQYAHEQGVIHRDLKPANILLAACGLASSRGEEDAKPQAAVPKIADFGLARRATGDSTLTAEGQVLGTPAYLSPEQARGDSHRVDARSDVYSLGVILYQLLTGELPFLGNSRMVLRQVLEDEPRPPRRLNDDVPRDLETVCLKAMAKEPARRYPTAAAFADDLRRLLKGEPVRARPVGPLGRLARWGRRKPVAAALVLVTAVGFAAVTWQWRRAESQRRRAEENYRQAHQLVNDFMHLSESPLLQPGAARPIRRDLMETCLKYYQAFLTEHGDDPALRAEAAHCRLRTAFFTYQLAPDRKAAEPAALQACADGRLAWQQLLAADPANGKYRTELAWVDLWEGEVRFDDREFAQALECFTRARDLHSGAAPSPQRQQNLAFLTYWIGFTQRRLKRSTEACQTLGQAVALYQALMEADGPTAERQAQLSQAYYHLGEELRNTGREAEALAANQHIIALSESPLLKDFADPGLYWVQGKSWYAVAKSKEAGQPREAIPYFQRAAQFYQRQIREDPPGEAPLGELGACYQHLGDLYRGLGDLREAVACYEKALPIREQRWQMDTWLGRREALVQTCWSLGQTLEQLNRPDEALSAYLRAVDPRRITPKEGKATERRRLSELYRKLAPLLRQHGRTAEAGMLELQEQALWENGPAGH